MEISEFWGSMKEKRERVEGDQRAGGSQPFPLLFPQMCGARLLASSSG